jgi:hypothetical protein
MSDLQTATITSSLSANIDTGKVIQDLSESASTLQSLIDHPESVGAESIRYIPAILKQAQETMLEAEMRLQGYEKKLKEVQQIITGFNEMQTLLDILPVGIIIAHDPQNQNMTINRAGLKMLNLPPETNPSKSAPTGDDLSFKVLRAGKELPAEELPMQYATTHRIAVHDVELDVLHSDGKVINLIEYASPLYNDQGIVSGSLGVLVDITAHKSIEKRLATQYNIARVLVESNSINRAAAQLLQMICETGGWEFGALWRVETETLTLTNEGVWHGDTVNLSKLAEATRYSALNGNDTNLPAFVLQQGQPLWLSNLEEFHSQDAIDAENAGLHSAFILPVFSGNKVIAILECFSNRSQIQDQNLTEMLNAVGNQIGIFLERKQLEEALAIRASQQHLLAEAGLALSSSLDYDKRLLTIVNLIVPDLADWCAIDIIDHNHILRRVAAAHVDPSKEKLLYEIQPTRPVDLNKADRPQVDTLQTGQSLLYTDISFSIIEESITDPQQLERIRLLDPRSSIVVPMFIHDRILGICTFVQSDSRRRY